MQKIDIYNHIFPEPFHTLMMKVAGDHTDMGERVRGIPMLTDLDERLRMMDRFGDDYRQVLSLASPPLEALGGPDVAIQLAQAANDGMPDLVRTHPDRFPSFIASLPLNAADAIVPEIDRAINDLGACGVQVFTNVLGTPLTAPEFRPLFAAMASHDLPIWLHPARGANFSDYLTETASKYEIWWTFGWPYETSAIMSRIVFEGLFDDYPTLKIITHHMGGMVPYFEGRVGHGWDQLGSPRHPDPSSHRTGRQRDPPLDRTNRLAFRGAAAHLRQLSGGAGSGLVALPASGRDGAVPRRARRSNVRRSGSPGDLHRSLSC